MIAFFGRWRRRLASAGQRGSAVTLQAVILIPTLLLGVGLVVDGGGKVAAAREAQTAATGAARAAQNATASDQLSGGSTTPAAYQAAQTYLAQTGASGTVTGADGGVSIHTTATYEPVFLSMIGVGTMTADGHAQAELAVVGP